MDAQHPPPLPPAAAGATATAPPLAAASVTPSGATAFVPPRRLSSQSLFGPDREVEIEHAGQLYRLRQTSLGKLILTK